MGVLDSVINGVSSVGAGIIGAIGAKKQRDFEQAEAQKQREWSETQTANQNAWNFEMWQKQNEYNSPLEQVKRMREAGLNPLYHGLDGTSAGELTAAQPLGYDRASSANFSNPIQAGLDAAMKVAQISNVRADTAKKGEETQSEVTRREQMQQQIENAKQELQNLKAEEGLTQSRKAEIDKALEWADRLNEAAVAAKEADAALSKSQKKRIDELLEGEKNIQIKTLNDFDERWKEIQARCAKMAKETGLLQKDIENYALNHSSNGFMGTGLSIQNLVRAAKSGAKPTKEQRDRYSDSSTDNLRDIIAEGQ